MGEQTRDKEERENTPIVPHPEEVFERMKELYCVFRKEDTRHIDIFPVLLNEGIRPYFGNNGAFKFDCKVDHLRHGGKKFSNFAVEAHAYPRVVSNNLMTYLCVPNIGTGST